MNEIILILPESREKSPLIRELKKIAANMHMEFEYFVLKKDFDLNQQILVLCAMNIARMTVIDCTIPSDPNDGGVYPYLAAQINSYNHVIVVSENNPPLNITPFRKICPNFGETLSMDKIIEELPETIEKSYKEDTYRRMTEDEFKEFLNNKEVMEKMIEESLDFRKKRADNKKHIMISYRNIHFNEVIGLKNLLDADDDVSREERVKMGAPDDYKVTMLEPASLCGASEAHTPMRRWMLVGLLDDFIRSVDELWVYESRDENGDIDYLKSWWTIAELVMVNYVNFHNEKKINVRVYNSAEHKLYETVPNQYILEITEKQNKRLARLLSNTRPDTMGPECMEEIKKLKFLSKLMSSCPFDIKEEITRQIKDYAEMSVPSSFSDKDRENLVNEMVDMYCDPEKMEEYANDEVFSNEFWNKISYQTSPSTGCYKGGRIDIDAFLSVPMDEVTDKTIEDFEKSANSVDGKITLKGSSYKVRKMNNSRYLWLATRMGKVTKKNDNAPGLEKISIFNVEPLS